MYVLNTNLSCPSLRVITLSLPYNYWAPEGGSLLWLRSGGTLSPSTLGDETLASCRYSLPLLRNVDKVGPLARLPAFLHKAGYPAFCWPPCLSRGLLPCLHPLGVVPCLLTQGVTPCLLAQGVTPCLLTQGVTPCLLTQGVTPLPSCTGLSSPVYCRSPCFLAPGSMFLCLLQASLPPHARLSSLAFYRPPCLLAQGLVPLPSTGLPASSHKA